MPPILNKIKQSIIAWHQGKYIDEPQDSPFIQGKHQRHWTAAIIHQPLIFYKQHWQWLLSFILVAVGILVNLKQF